MWCICGPVNNVVRQSSTTTHRQRIDHIPTKVEVFQTGTMKRGRQNDTNKFGKELAIDMGGERTGGEESSWSPYIRKSCKLLSP